MGWQGRYPHRITACDLFRLYFMSIPTPQYKATCIPFLCGPDAPDQKRVDVFYRILKQSLTAANMWGIYLIIIGCVISLNIVGPYAHSTWVLHCYLPRNLGFTEFTTSFVLQVYIHTPISPYCFLFVLLKAF